MGSSVTWSELLRQLQHIVSRIPQNARFIGSSERRLISELLLSYTPKRGDYQKFISYSEKGYTKNLVQSFGPTCNVIVMCWSPLQASAFHGHEGSNCFVKVLEGELSEMMVPYPNKTISLDDVAEKRLKKDQTTYIDDTLGVHKVKNLSNMDPAITLHIYLPAYTKVRIFEDYSVLRLDRSTTKDVEFNNDDEKVDF